MNDKKKSNEDQRKRFIETARSVGADEDSEAFKDRLKEFVNSEVRTAQSGKSKKKKRGQFREH